MMAAALSSLCALPAVAGKPDALDKEFLDYLASCESKDDNWTVVASDKVRRKLSEKAPAKPVAPADKPTPEAKP